MTARSYTDIWCDGPGKDGEGCLEWCDYATDANAARARAKARAGGWRVALPGGRDLCPQCAKAEEAGP